MRCNICDNELSDKEISFNKELDAFEPCTVCLDAAMEAAYCDGFVTEDDDVVILDASFDETPLPSLFPFYESESDSAQT